jgi:dolichol-phosphate mannosyltransferase
MLAGAGMILAAVLAITSGAMAGLLVFLWAVLMTAVAVVGVYVIRIYKDVRGRPPFIIESSIGFGDNA